MSTGDLDGSGEDDLIAAFEGYGLFVYYNNTFWSQLHGLSPTLITTGDIDGNGEDDLIAAFEGYGLFVYYNNTFWSQLHGLVPELMTTDDIDFSGKEDLIVDFGPSFGTYVYYDNASWDKLHGLSPTFMLADDIGGVILGFSGYGLYVYDGDVGSWWQLHNVVPEAGAIADINGDDAEVGVFDFGDYGIWLYDDWNGGIWTKIHGLSADDDAGICGAELDAN
jgi:hypothetical protein